MLSLTALIVILAIVGVTYGLSPWRRVGNAKDESAEDKKSSKAPSASVVAYVQRDEENLSEYLDLLLNQDYADFEVVLVCDASAEATAVLSDKFERVEKLHLTFIPPGSHHLSRRKLAQTLGIKRASGEVVVITSTSVKPRSEKWLSEMVSPFREKGCDVVCGYVHPTFSHYRGASKWYRQFDASLTSAQWMAEAFAGAPYRGDGYNIAFRRNLFFEAKGYASTLTLMDGDDDIFVKEICRPGSGRMVLSPDSIVDTQWGEEADRIHLDLKDRYSFTRKYLPKAPFIRAGVLSAINWLMLGAIATGGIGIYLLILHLMPAGVGESFRGGEISDDFSIIMIMMSAICFITFITFWLTEILTYRKLAQKLGNTKLFWGVYPFMLWRPIGNFLFFLNHYPQRKSHYTWVRN